MAEIRLQQVCKRYGDVTAVEDLNLHCRQGEMLALLGPSGCGKSSTLKMIAGIEPLTSGTIFFDDTEVSDLAPSTACERGAGASMSRRARVLVAAAVLVGAQIAAVVVYRVIERSRVADPGSFASERLAGSPVAPDLVLERADGSRLRLADLAGRVRLVHFWATWCPPCVEELPGLLATSRELEPRGLTLLAISMDKDWAQIRRFFPDEVPAEVVRAVAADAHRRYDVASLPDTYLVDETGRLTRRYGGARDWRRGAAIEHLRDQVSR